MEAYGEETPDGFILLRRADNGIVGMTVVDYWRRFGVGALGDVALKTLDTVITAQAQSLEYALAA